MALIDENKKLLQCKIVYYGTGLGGKKTNLRVIYDKTDPKMRGRLLSLETETKPTLLFNFVPISVGKIKGLDTRFNFYSVPGQSFNNVTRKALLKDVDGVVFVADSHADRLEADIDSILNLDENLRAYERELDGMPHVLQYNKRDLEGAVPVARMREELNRHDAPDFEAIAIHGLGVLETRDAIVKRVTDKAIEELGL